MNRTSSIHTLLLVLGLTFPIHPAHALTVRIVADTLTIHADKTPLSEILARLQTADVRVAMDSRIDPLITAHFDNLEISKGMKRILSDCDYALFMDTIEGPDGKMNRLSEVLVYKPGDRRTLKPRAPPPPEVTQTRTATNVLLCINNEILLRLRPGTSREQFRTLLLKTGAMVLDGIPALGIYRLRLPPGSNLAETLNSLAGDPLVSVAEPNLVYRSITPVNTGAPESAANPLTATATTGPAVAILDSGFAPNSTLEKAVIATLDATAPGQAITDPLGHGTQMAFLASGSITPDGAEPASASVSIIPIRTMDDGGIATSFSLMQSMVFALENGARVISMSWGSNGNTSLFDDAIAYARQRGAILVAAAGNEPTGQPLYPAALPDVIAVAATLPDGNLWDQSNYGSFVKVAAPGFANLPVGYKGPPGQYGGTSIAAAYTANVIAQYLAAHPKATAAEAISALTQSLTQAPATSGTLHPEIPRLTSASTSTFLK